MITRTSIVTLPPKPQSLDSSSKPSILKDWEVFPEPFISSYDIVDLVLIPPDHITSFDEVAHFYHINAWGFIGGGGDDDKQLRFKLRGIEYLACSISLLPPYSYEAYSNGYLLCGCEVTGFIKVSAYRTVRESPQENALKYKQTFWGRLTEKWDNFLLRNS